MRKMKDSGIPWIGEIPEAWEVDRLQWHLTEIKEANKPEKTRQVLSLTNKRGVIPYEEKGAQGNIAKEDYTQYKLAYPGTIIANSMNILIGSVGRCDYFGCVSPVYYVFKPLEGENLAFLNYVFQMEQFQRELRRYANGILEIRLRVSSSDILKRKIAFPSLSEQRAIADYLDEKCGQIGALVKNVQAQIEKLKAYKQSLISEVVTKGLNPNAPMKNSGIDWIGEIPEKWEVKRLKFCVSQLKEKWTNEYANLQYIGLENIESGSGRKIETESVYEKDQSIIFSPRNVLFGKLRPYLAKVYLAKETGCCSSEFCVFQVADAVDEKFLWSVLISQGFIDQVNFSTYGTKMPRANSDFVKNMNIPLPPLSEQQAIADYLDDKCGQVDRLVALKEAKIAKLEAYKKSLIYEVVTGKRQI